MVKCVKYISRWQVFNMSDKLKTVSENVDRQGKYSADLDQALAVAGMGCYNIYYSVVLGSFLVAAIVEPLGYSFVLPAAACDLEMTDSQRGFISSIPYIGVVVTSFPWGYMVDTQGRKKSLIYSSLTAGAFGILSGFMPDLTSFMICKFLTSLCIACPAAAPYTYVGEIMPGQYVDIMMSITNALQITGSALVPLIAWAILPSNFQVDFGAYYLRPWRVLTMLYATVFIIGALLISFGPESPKYLVSQGKTEEALKVLQTMYAKNKKKSPEDYPIKMLNAPLDTRKKVNFFKSLKAQSWPLLNPPYLKWMALNGFLLFGIFAVINGLYMWVPDILNRVMSEGGAGRTACEVIYDRLNQTAAEDAECNDTIDRITFVINSISTGTCSVLAIAISSTVKFIGKKRLLVCILFLIGIFLILINFITQDLLFAIMLSSISLMGLTIGPVNAYAVEIFPTHLKGMAVGLTMMVGRSGSIVGTNVAGLLLNAACEVTFYAFGGLLLLCGVLTFLLPKSKGSPHQRPVNRDDDVTRL